MRILLTNDDGVNAGGLKVLERIARQISDDIWIVAPTEEQSGAGHSLTLSRPIRLRKLGERRFCVSGTPTDSVMMAIAHIMKDAPPDLVLSGVNRGANLGEDCTYSGTVSAAMEGALAGIPAIALSQCYAREGMGDTVPFAAAEAWAARARAPAGAAARPEDPGQHQLPGSASGRRQGDPSRPAGHSRLWPLADRPAH
jgi:5'-nucleotidase